MTGKREVSLLTCIYMSVAKVKLAVPPVERKPRPQREERLSNRCITTRSTIAGCSCPWPSRDNCPDVLSFRRIGPNPLNHKDYDTALTIFRTTFLLFYDKFLQYVTKFATMTSGQRNKSVVHPEQREMFQRKTSSLSTATISVGFLRLPFHLLVICHWNANRARDRVFYEISPSIRESCRPGVGNKGNWIPIAGE
ncbi:unnamed protein product [Heterotrigona itama]|uniref:Uncharacterized protein n=1 Tax=Heterotrigona itama TaxID=395501 RepID=A0A6V7H5N6_9HYME|nr:unnamed protein product [Heterotrigona itama]